MFLFVFIFASSHHYLLKKKIWHLHCFHFLFSLSLSTAQVFYRWLGGLVSLSFCTFTFYCWIDGWVAKFCENFGGNLATLELSGDDWPSTLCSPFPEEMWHRELKSPTQTHFTTLLLFFKLAYCTNIIYLWRLISTIGTDANHSALRSQRIVYYGI